MNDWKMRAYKAENEASSQKAADDAQRNEARIAANAAEIQSAMAEVSAEWSTYPYPVTFDLNADSMARWGTNADGVRHTGRLVKAGAAVGEHIGAAYRRIVARAAPLAQRAYCYIDDEYALVFTRAQRGYGADMVWLEYVNLEKPSRHSDAPVMASGNADADAWWAAIGAALTQIERDAQR